MSSVLALAMRSAGEIPPKGAPSDAPDCAPSGKVAPPTAFAGLLGTLIGTLADDRGPAAQDASVVPPAMPSPPPDPAGASPGPTSAPAVPDILPPGAQGPIKPRCAAAGAEDRPTESPAQATPAPAVSDVLPSTPAITPAIHDSLLNIASTDAPAADTASGVQAAPVVTTAIVQPPRVAPADNRPATPAVSKAAPTSPPGSPFGPFPAGEPAADSPAPARPAQVTATPRSVRSAASREDDQSAVSTPQGTAPVATTTAAITLPATASPAAPQGRTETTQAAATATALPARQLVPALVSLAAAPDGGRILTVQLAPVTLGQVQVRVERTGDGAATVAILAARPETAALLAQDRGQLHLALADAGLSVSDRALTIHIAQAAPDAGPASAPVPPAAHSAPAQDERPQAHLDARSASSPDASGGSQGGAAQDRGGHKVQLPSDDSGLCVTIDGEAAAPLFATQARWFRAGLDITA